MSFHRIAYETLDICNALEMSAIDRAVERSGLAPGARALDIGCGNATIARRLAEGFGLEVTAVELDPAMAALARERVGGAPVRVHEGRSAEALADALPFDLIVAIGSTDPVGDGRREPNEMFAGLRNHLAPGGWLLWGDLVWTTEPPEPLRFVVEMTNTYASDAGWRAAADSAGLEVVSTEMSSAETWEQYTTTMDHTVRAWLDNHPDDEAAPGVRASADRIKAMFDFGRPYIDFGLYLLHRPAS